MTIQKQLLIAFTLIISITATAQDMSEGFGMLDSGDFKRAESYFENVLKEFPNNKTASLCYARAVGLAGDPNRATDAFKKMLATYPDDLEILLNLAESYLWNKKPVPAIVTYLDILNSDSTLFGAQLGIANSYSMNTQYELAYTHIKIALAIQPDNAQATLSAKYIRLGLANRLASELHRYEEAYALIAENMAVDAEDQESLGLLANVYLIAGNYAAADSSYRKMSNLFNSLKGQSIALHLLGHDEKALSLSKEVLVMGQEGDSARALDANLHYVSALLWNNEIRLAKGFLDSLSAIPLTSPELFAAQAQVSMYEADFKKGVAKFSHYLASMPTSFKGNLGKADAMHALGLDNEAYELAFKTLTYYPGQKDATNFVKKLNGQHSPKASVGYGFGKSSDGSANQFWNVGGAISLSPLFSTHVMYQQKTFTVNGEATNLSSQLMTISAKRQINQLIKLDGSIAMVKTEIGQEHMSNQRTNINFSTGFNISKVQTLTIGYQSELQDFNAALLRQNLKTNHLAIKNAMFWKLHNIGSYTEVYRSFYSDGNHRNLLFTSLYKNLDIKPKVKFGANFLIMSFAENKPEYYYSPERYYQPEVFVGLEHGGEKSFIITRLDAAGGFQFIEGEAQSTWRAQLSFSKTVGKLQMQINGAYSSITAMQSNGFSHFQVNAQCSFQLSDKPIFYKRITQ